ncbi:hypothetical protein Taro_032218 [Colocasia esculenta]|uniref:Uncharacterized protein n=1 Tax=Colocasia esculenta TaxID=4460 RepID=A0A843VU99_COLES|nr:hypothetical protein [Colocasia esculenta]
MWSQVDSGCGGDLWAVGTSLSAAPFQQRTPADPQQLQRGREAPIWQAFDGRAILYLETYERAEVVNARRKDLQVAAPTDIARVT